MGLLNLAFGLSGMMAGRKKKADTTAPVPTPGVQVGGDGYDVLLDPTAPGFVETGYDMPTGMEGSGARMSAAGGMNMARMERLGNPTMGQQVGAALWRTGRPLGLLLGGAMGGRRYLADKAAQDYRAQLDTLL